MKKLMAVLIVIAMLCGAALPALAEGSVKDETVYILSEADGSARRIIVSDWLSNPGGDAELADVSSLNGIENVKGEQPFDGSVWQADGQDIYYQGEGTAPLPVEMKITYALDGEEIAPAALAGKDGRVTIRFDYSVAQTADVQVKDQSETISVPYAVITGVLLENDVFTNVEAVNARVINDGDHTFVVGIALPGVQESLKLDGETVQLPEYVQIEADAKAFALPVTVTAATSEVFAKLDADDLNGVDDLKRSMNELTDGMAQLIDGGAQLSSGLAELADGTNQLADGVGALSDGLSELVGNSETLIDGSTQVFNTLLATANQQLAASEAGVPELTIENYAETLSALIESMSEEGIARQARAKVEQAVRAQEDQVREAVMQAVREEVQAQVEAAVRENVLEQVLNEAGLTPESYAAAKEGGQLTDEQAAQIEGAVAQQMDSDDMKAIVDQQVQMQMASDDVLAIADQNTEAQVQLLIEQNMESDDVRAQIEAGLAQYQSTCASLTALKEQLDAYNAFHSGLIAYTSGASAAADGAAQLKSGIPALQEGVAQLQDGAQALCDGLAAFSEEGVERLDALVNDDLDALLERVRGLIQAAQGAQNYSGIADGADGAVRFIWRTDAIEP